MPRVPIPAGNLVEQRPMTDAKFQGADNGGGIGGGIARGLQDLGQAGSQFAQVQDHINAQVDEASAKQVLIEYQGFRNQQVYTGNKAFASLSGQDALNARMPVEKSLDDKIGELSSRLTSPRAKTMFTRAVGEERLRDGLTIGTHAVQQAKVWNDQQDSALQGQAGQDFIGATLRNDTDGATMALGTLTKSIDNQYDRNGLSGAPAALARTKAISALHAGVIDAKMRADPVGAAAYMHDHASEIQPTDAAKLSDSLYGPLLEREASAVVDGYAGAAAGVAPAAPSPTPGSGSLLSRMVPITAFSESGNRDTTATGAVVTSSAGARGRMQVMPTTARDPGYGIKPSDGTLVDDARVGREKLGKMLDRYGGDPAKAWAAYNWGEGNVDRAVKANGDQWLAHAPAETQGYVRKNVSMLGGADAPTYAPRRDDLAGIYAYIEGQNLPFDVKKAALAEADHRVARNDRLLNRQQDDAKDQAYRTIDQLGDGFTSINQLDAATRRNLSPEAFHALSERAQQNAKPQAIPADGQAVGDLHVLANAAPDAFIKTDLRLYQTKMTPGEYNSLRTLQSSMAAKPNSEQQIAHSRVWSQINFYGRDIGINMAAKAKGESDEAFKARRSDGMRLFSVVDNYLQTLTQGKRQPTDDEIKKAYDNAVIMRQMPDGTAGPRYRDATLPTNSVAVPQAAHDAIARGLKARGLPYDDRHVALVYMQGK